MILGIGTDIVSTERLDRMCELHGDRFLTRVFTRREIETAGQRATLAERLGTVPSAVSRVLALLKLSPADQ